MDITYLGHSCFKLKGKSATVVCDPFSQSVGFAMSKLSADVVTVSHDHDDHNNLKAISGTARRENPFVIDTPGEYEVESISVFGVASYHDEKKGEDRGNNVMYSLLVDGVSVVHLGDLGHKLSDTQVAELNGVDVLLCPTGGVYTIDAEKAVGVINVLEPSIVIPMHYKTPEHDQKVFGKLAEVDDFVKLLSLEPKKQDKLSVSQNTLPEEMELVILEK